MILYHYKIFSEQGKRNNTSSDRIKQGYSPRTEMCDMNPLDVNALTAHLKIASNLLNSLFVQKIRRKQQDTGWSARSLKTSSLPWQGEALCPDRPIKPEVFASPQGGGTFELLHAQFFIPGWVPHYSTTH
jgi:hypothetical protein